MGEGIYVVGIEPTNAPLQLTRKEMREQGLMPILQPGEQKVFNLEIGVLTNRAEIDQFRQFVSQLMMGR